MSDAIATIAARPLRSTIPGPGLAWLGEVGRGLGGPALKRALPALVVLAVLAFVALAVMAVREPRRAALFPGLADADKAAVVQALETGGFDVAIDPATGAVEVPTSDVYRARMLLAQAGLPKAVPGGYDLLADMPLGASRAMERARMKQAQEGELARAIEGVGGVASARVMLAVAEPTPFVRDNAQPAASVFVALQPGRALSEAQVRAIQHLVGSSVPGLASDRVSVVDGAGQLLSGDASGELGESQRQLGFQGRMERQYRDRIAALLSPVLGAGNYSAQVALDLDFTQAEQTSERYQPGNSALRSEASASRSDATPQPRGVPGALTNTAPPAPQVTGVPPAAPGTIPPAAPAAPPVNTEQSLTRNYEVGREVAVTKPAVGRVRKLAVAVVVREIPIAGGATAAVPSPTVLRQLVAAAVGFDARRGDVVTVVRQPFAAPPVEARLPVWRAVAQDHAGHVVALVAVLAAAVIARTLLRRARPSPVPQATPTLLTPVTDSAGAAAPDNAPLAALDDGSPTTRLEIEDQLASLRPATSTSVDILSAANSYDDKVAAIRLFVGEDPARASSVLKQLLRQGAIT